MQIALWENEVAFDYARIDDPAHAAAWQQASPFGKMPLLVDGDAVIPETTIIVERLAEAGIEPSVGSVGDSYDNPVLSLPKGLWPRRSTTSTNPR